jgi:two-component system sensor histidine kinase RstB
MARLFLTLYITIISAIFSFFFIIDYMASEHYYNIEKEGIRKSATAYSGLFQQIFELGGTDIALEAMHKAMHAEDLLLTEVTDQEIIKDNRFKDTSVFVQSNFLDGYDIYVHAFDDKYYEVVPDENSKGWQAEEALGRIYMFGFFFTLALILGPWVYFLHRKLKVLELSAIKISNGEFSTRVSEKYNHKVGGLNAAFNNMAARIEQLIASHQRLTNAVAHELRTPIFRLRCQAELLEYGSSEEDHKHYIEGIEEDLSELDLLVNEMLSFARMELNQELFLLEPQELQQWLANNHTILQRSCKKNFAIGLGPEIICRFDSRLLLRALSNLVRNADIHAKSSIQITHHIEGDNVLICVEDDGLGIPVHERERILEPFERLDDARTRESGGHGLGLSIVRAIVQQHNGKIMISQSVLGGACFSFYLPLDQQS